MISHRKINETPCVWKALKKQFDFKISPRREKAWFCFVFSVFLPLQIHEKMEMIFKKSLQNLWLFWLFVTLPFWLCPCGLAGRRRVPISRKSQKSHRFCKLFLIEKNRKVRKVTGFVSCFDWKKKQKSQKSHGFCKVFVRKKKNRKVRKGTGFVSFFDQTS